jgi:hypothetical protein
MIIAIYTHFIRELGALRKITLALKEVNRAHIVDNLVLVIFNTIKD